MLEQSIFIEALDKEDPAERAAFLDRACASDPALRPRIERLLQHHRRADETLDSPSPWAVATIARPSAEGPGTVIGPYKLMEPIGEGGMGVVYVAEQTQPIRRRVALKVIKPGMDTNQVLARFEAERQALALMDHPNIAKVHDAGAAESGRPYFVMELVKGVPITDYCDEAHLSIRDRLDLFVLVCRAVQHAHQKGIIHRDLKPSNILVTVVDGVPTPKVIDFGVAKATGQALTDKTVYTGFHQFIGTPLYMSPEQADLAGADVDTRSDVYSLGVLLYELLTGATPFDSETLNRAAFDEMRRIIREEEPPRPSMRLSSLGEKLSTVSARRKADPRRLGSSLKGELDWVVMKALEKDRRRRYETANDFAADVMRHLADLPVEACPPSAWYRLTKFSRRNRAALATGAVLFLALTAGMAVSSWQAVQADRARREADDALATARRAVDEMYTDVANEWLSQSVDLSPLQRKFLEKALALYEQFAARRGADADVRFQAVEAAARVATIRGRLGGAAQVIAPLRQAKAGLLGLISSNPGRDDFKEALASVHSRLADALLQLGEKQEALRETQEAVAIKERLVEKNPADVDSRNQLAMEQINFGGYLKALGRVDEAAAVLIRCCDNFERLSALKPDDAGAFRHNLAVAVANLGEAKGESGHYAEAESCYKKAYDIHMNECKGFDSDCAGYAASALALTAVLHEEQGRHQDAADSMGRAVALYDQLSARSPTSTAIRRMLIRARGNLASYLKAAGKPGEGEESLRRALSEAERLVADFPDHAESRELLVDRAFELGQMLKADGRLPEAIGPYERSLEAFEKLAEDFPDRDRYRQALVVRLCFLADDHSIRLGPRDRDPSRAVAIARGALELDPKKDLARQSLGWALYRAGDWKGCVESLEKQPDYAQDGDFFAAMAYWRLGDQTRARDLFDRFDAWLTGYEKRWKPDVYPEPTDLRVVRAEAAALLGVASPQRGAATKPPD